MPTSHKEKLTTKIRYNTFQLTGDSLFLVACLMFAFIIRFLLIPQDFVINTDGVYYTILGERIVSGDLEGGISAYWSPFYSVLTGISSLFFEDRAFGGRFVSLVSGSLLVLPAYLFIRDIYGRLAAYIGTILLVFQPLLIKSSGWVMTESLYTLVLITCVLSAWHALCGGELRSFLLTGLLLGTAFLIKPEAIGYLVLMFGLLAGAKLFNSNVSFLRQGANYLILLLGFALFFLPYFFFLHSKTGVWTFSQKIMVNVPAIDYEGELLALSENGRTTMKDRILSDDYETAFRGMNPPAPAVPPPLTLSRLKSDVAVLGTKAFTLLKIQIREYLPSILSWPLLILAIVGFFARPWTRIRAAKEIFLISFVISTLLGYAISVIDERYLFPIIPILLAWVANGIIEFSEWFVETVKTVFGTVTKVSSVLISTCILILSLGSFVPAYLNVFKGNDIVNLSYEEKNAGLWIKEHNDVVEPVVMSSNAAVAFYADSNHLYLPDEELSVVLNYAKSRKVNYIVFSKRRVSDGRGFLEEKNSEFRDLTLVYKDQSGTNYEILVYQLNY